MNEPVGHASPFSGDSQLILHCVTDLVSRVRNGDYYSYETVMHVAVLTGEVNEFRKPDESGPVFAMAPAEQPATITEWCDQLESAVAPKATEDAKAGFDWALVLQLIQLLWRYLPTKE